MKKKHFFRRCGETKVTMSNRYSFAFLRSEHTLSGVDAPIPPPKVSLPTPSIQTVSAESVAHKPDLEKQADILRFLKAHRSSGYLPPSIIYRGTGIDLDEADESVAQLLEKNPKISIEQVPDPENPQIMISTYAYQSKFNHVRDRATLLAQINRSKYGVDLRDLSDCYDGVEEDIKDLYRAGDIIAVNNSEDKTHVLFPRGETFLIELDGIITVGGAYTSDEISGYGAHYADAASRHRNDRVERHNVVSVDTDIDPTKQIRRGEAVCVGGQWFRVSSAVRPGASLEDQPSRAQAPLTVTSMTDLSKKNLVDGYVRPFNEKNISIDKPLSKEALGNLIKAKEARKLLHKLVGGRGHSTGATSQLLSNLAHSSNPATLAASFSSGMAGSRKRPAAKNKVEGSTTNVDQVRNDAKAVQEAASNPNLFLYSHARRHGCTSDVREMYLQTRNLIPTDEKELYNLLIEHKLLEPGEAWRRPKLAKKADVDNDGKKKKRRYYERKNQRITNTHLVGTAVGALLADAAEKQKQGKSVGDGGM
jgi:TFA2 Winged helix domain 2